jgi:alanyl-tRNA synthetase
VIAIEEMAEGYGMKRLSSTDIRQQFLTFFAERGHAIVPSSSLVPGNDPTLLFANSGMVQFKDTFLGLEQRPYTRATTSQKCLRVSGKHNDLDEVGPSPRHQTFFEMLGNFSFGDYFKRDAIRYAWELLTQVFQLPPERLWFTVFAGNEQVSADEEAVQLWREVGVDPSRILRFGAKDNFWEMGPTGPCGPNSEIHYYQGDDPDRQSASGVNSDDPMYMEIWNLVFMQYNRDAQGVLTPLPRPSIDTGMGFERMVAVAQGVRNNYDTDVFTPILQRIIALRGTDEAHYQAHFAPYRAVADHSRSIAFLVADGVLPGKNGRQYVLRRILRRAAYQGRLIGFERPFLADVVSTVIEQMGDAYPELRQRREFILETTDVEERQFLRTLSSGLVRLDGIVEQTRRSGVVMLPGEDAFQLQDTYGFPLDLTEKIAESQGLTIDVAGFEAAMENQRRQSRTAAQFKRGAESEAWAEQELPATAFTGYDRVSDSGSVFALVTDGEAFSVAREGQRVQVALDRTPFYAESGGQVGDSGALIGPNGRIRVENTQRPLPGLIVHFGVVEQGEVALGDVITAQVDLERRLDIMRNHTATHLLHRALRDVLGEHAAQAGSLVAPDRLRFDFSHMRSVTPEQIHEIEARVNEWVRADTPVEWEITGYQDALNRGAIALFGEKYTDQVRMVTIGCVEQRTGVRGQGSEAQNLIPDSRPLTPGTCSRELCGGTHVARTGEIGYFRIVGESSVAAGVRRIEALTGRGAEVWADTQASVLRDIAARLGVTPAQVLERVDGLLAELKQRQNELNALHAQSARGSLEGLLNQVQRQNGIVYLAARVDAPDAARFREMGDWLRDKIGSGVIVLGAVMNDKPQLMAIVTRDLLDKGYHAGNIVKALAPVVGGGGGGRPDMAQAGGRDASKLDEALSAVAGVLAAQVS